MEPCGDLGKIDSPFAPEEVSVPTSQSLPSKAFLPSQAFLSFQMSLFDEQTFIGCYSNNLNYEKYLEFIRFLISDVINSNDEEDIKEYIRLSEYLIRILKEADKPAYIGSVGLPHGIIYCGMMTVREVFDHIADHLEHSPRGRPIYFNGLDYNYTAVTDYTQVTETLYADCENPDGLSDSEEED